MTHIEEQILINGNKKDIFHSLKNMKSFPAFMRYIDSLKVDQVSPVKFVSDWSINMDGVPVRWKEEDVVDENNFVINFNMINGDYAKYKGRWEVIDSAHGTKVRIVANIDWGAPAFTSFKEVKTILRRKTIKAFKGMLLAIKRQIEHKGK